MRNSPVSKRRVNGGTGGGASRQYHHPEGMAITHCPGLRGASYSGNRPSKTMFYPDRVTSASDGVPNALMRHSLRLLLSAVHFFGCIQSGCAACHAFTAGADPARKKSVVVGSSTNCGGWTDESETTLPLSRTRQGASILLFQLRCWLSPQSPHKRGLS